MATNKRKIGDIGEEVVCKYLVKKLFVIVDRNYLKPWGEIDIIAKNVDSIRFVEVKTISTSNKRGEISRETFRPEENMHVAKVRRLHRAIATYLLEKKIPEHISWQLDLACVYLNFDTKRARVEMFENVII